MIITTSENLEGYTIQKYLQPIISNKFMDNDREIHHFDMRSISNHYTMELEKINNSILEDLIYKAKSLQADAIIGLTINYNEISPQNKLLFLGTGCGTAVKIERKIELDKISTTELVEIYRKNKLEIYSREFEKRNITTNALQEMITQQENAEETARLFEIKQQEIALKEKLASLNRTDELRQQREEEALMKNPFRKKLLENNVGMIICKNCNCMNHVSTITDEHCKQCGQNIINGEYVYTI